MSYRWEFSNAVREGNVGKVQYLLRYHELSAWSGGYILLKDALENGHVAVANLLLDADARVHKKSGKPTDTPLHYAAEWGFKDIVERLLTKGARVNAANKSDTTPLHRAARKGHDGIVKLLLQHGAFVNASDTYGITPLHVSVEYGNVPITQNLLNYGASVFCSRGGCYDKYTPLHTAAYQGFEEICKLLLSKGASVNALSARNGTPLHVAIQKGHLNLVKLFLRYEVDTKATNYNGDTCLHVAAREGSEDVVNALLANGFSVDVTNCEGVTPAFLALKKGHSNIVRLLLEQGADVNFQDKNGNTILCTAVEERSESFVDLVLKFSPDVNNERNKSTIKSAALQYGYRSDKIIERLLQYGFKANLNVDDEKDVEVLHAAVEKGYFKLVEDMLKSCQDVVALINARGSNGRTSLHVAVEKRRPDFVNLLMRFGADVNVQDNNGNTILCIAVKSGYESFVDLILALSPDVNNEQNGCALKIVVLECGYRSIIIERLLQYGFKAHLKVDDAKDIEVLHTAIEKGYFKLVKDLLKSSRDVVPVINAKGSKGCTSLHVAVEKKRPDFVNLLIRFGGDVNAQDNNGNTILYNVVKTGAPARIIDFILSYSPDVNIEQNKRSLRAAALQYRSQTVLVIDKLLQYGFQTNLTADDPNDVKVFHAAVAKGYLQLVEEMLKSCENVDSLVNARGSIGDTKGLTSLHVASKNGQQEMVTFLIGFGADVNAMTSSLQSDFFPQEEKTPLFYSVENGYTNISKILLSNKAEGSDCLWIALDKRDPDLLGLLLQHGADPNTTDTGTFNRGAYCGFIAPYFRSSSRIEEKREFYRKMLCKCAIDIEKEKDGGHSVLAAAIEHKDPKLVKILLEYGAYVNGGAGMITDGRGPILRTPLMVAAENGNAEITTMLLDKGAAVNVALMPKEVTALHMAVCFKHRKVVYVLLKQPDIDFDCKDCEKKTPLHYAAENGDAVIALTLLKRGASVNGRDHLGKTPLHCAAEVGHEVAGPRCATYGSADIGVGLLRFGADPNARDAKHGFTPLHYLAANEMSQDKFFFSYLKYGAVIESKSTTGKTPLYVAVENGCQDNVSVLLRLGADVNITHIINETGKPSRQSTPLQFAEASLTGASPGSIRRQPEAYERETADEYVRSDRHVKWYPDEHRSNEDYENCGDREGEGLHNAADDSLFKSDFYNRVYNYEEFSEIVDIIRRHIIMLDCANFYVNDRDLKSVHLRGGDVINKYRRECQEELSLLKRTKVVGNPKITFYDFLMKSSNKLAKMFKKENLAEIRVLAKFRTDLRSLVIYRDLIDNRLDMALKRGNLLKSATECFVKVFSLPDLCADAITDFLRNIDLDNFVEACEQSKAKCSTDS